MASRAGSFGRMPRTAPDLASTIVAMLREYNNLIDTNMVNGWKEGGEVEGKKVTDAMIVAHWKERRDSVSKDDPLWDYYNQMVRDYTYSIAESKMSLRYAQRKVSDSQMAAFYRHWAGKLPTDSEGYRQLMRNAAQFVDAARSRARAGAAAASYAAYARAINNSYADSKEGAYDTVSQFLVDAARRDGILTGKEDLADLKVAFENDPTAMLSLIENINNGAWGADLKKRLTDAIRKSDPNFDGNFTYEYIQKAAGWKIVGVDARIRIANKAGRKEDSKAFKKEKDGVRGTAAYIAGWDEEALYWDYRNDFKAAIEDPKATAYEREAARQKYIEQLQGLIPGMVLPEKVGLIQNEIRALSGDTERAGHTMWSDSTGQTQADVGENSDYVKMAQAAKDDKQQVLDLESGRSVLVQGTVKDGKFTPSANGDTIGVMPRDAMSAYPGFSMPLYVTPGTLGVMDDKGNPQSLPTGGGGPREVYVPVQPITTTGAGEFDPTTGRTSEINPVVEQGQTNPMDTKVGVTAVVDGTRIYGIYIPGSAGTQVLWTPDNPFNQTAVLNSSFDKDGMKVTVRGDQTKGYNPQDAIAQPFKDPSMPNALSFVAPSDSASAPWLAAMLGSDEGRNTLRDMSRKDAWAFIYNKNGGDMAKAQQDMDVFDHAGQIALGGDAVARELDAVRKGMRRFLPDERDERMQAQRNAAASLTQYAPGEMPGVGKVDVYGNYAAVPEVLNDADARARAWDNIVKVRPWLAYTAGAQRVKGEIAAIPAIKLPDYIAKETGMGTPAWTAQNKAMPGGTWENIFNPTANAMQVPPYNPMAPVPSAVKPVAAQPPINPLNPQPPKPKPTPTPTVAPKAPAPPPPTPTPKPRIVTLPGGETGYQRVPGGPVML